MSQGFVHAKACLFLSAGFSIGALVSQDSRLLECALGSLTGIFLSPDLDVDNGNISNKLIRKEVGWFGERIWRWFWKGYSGSFKHGQFASHFPIFGTFIRLSYVYFLTILPFYLISVLILGSGYWSWAVLEMDWWAKTFFHPFFFFGLCGADIIHWVLDVSTTEHKV